MNFIDHHCHVSDERVFARAEIIGKSAIAAGVKTLVLAGTEPAEWKRQFLVRDQFKALGIRVVTNFGLHPWWVEKFSDDEVASALLELKRALEKQAPDGVGETGLDFGAKRKPERFEAQKSAFAAQLELATRFNKPVVLHVVGAHEPAIEILRRANAIVPLVVHSFSGNMTQLQGYLSMGAMISYSGSIVKSARGEGFEKVQKALLHTPSNRLLFETDSPDQYWGTGENQPSNVREVYEAAAKILGQPVQRLITQVEENFKKIYDRKNHV